MTTAVSWPPGLPSARFGFTHELVDMTVQTKMLTGRTRVRRLFPEGPSMANATFDLTGLQYLIFKSFFQNTLEHGARPFLMSMPTGDGNELVQAQFLGGYRVSHEVTRYVLTCPLQIERLPVVPEATAKALGSYGDPVEYAPFVSRLRVFVSSDVPATLGDITP